MGILNSVAAAIGKTAEEVACTLGLRPDADDRTAAEALLAHAARAGVLQSELADVLSVANVLQVPAEGPAVKAAILALRASQAAALSALRGRLGLKQEASEQDVLNAVDALQREPSEHQAENLVDAAVTSGRLAPAQREFFMGCARQDLEATRRCLESLGPLIAPRSPGHVAWPGPAAPGRELTEDERHICRLLGLSPQAFLNAIGMEQD